jgi:hypothetical protein
LTIVKHRVRSKEKLCIFVELAEWAYSTDSQEVVCFRTKFSGTWIALPFLECSVVGQYSTGQRIPEGCCLLKGLV